MAIAVWVAKPSAAHDVIRPREKPPSTGVADASLVGGQGRSRAGGYRHDHQYSQKDPKRLNSIVLSPL
jgi:hypothetical protein